MSTPIHIQYYKSAFGELMLGAFGGQLCLAYWRYHKMRSAIDKRIQTTFNAEYVEAKNPLLTETIRQLEAYFSGSRKSFDIPMLMAGTAFQQRVWKALQDIPYGTTKTYHEFALSLGDEKAIRAVATANGANAISILIPCHRIIGSDGSLVGYAGGLPTKKKLLQLEGAAAVAQAELF